MLLSRSVSITIVFCLILVACAVGGMAYVAGNGSSRAHATEAQATVEAERIAIQATVVAEREKSEQIRAKADAYGDKLSADLLAYVVTKSEERQDEMLYFIIHGETTAERDARFARNTAWIMVSFLALAAIGPTVVSVIDSSTVRHWLGFWLARLTPDREQRQESDEFTTIQTDETLDIE